MWKKWETGHIWVEAPEFYKIGQLAFLPLSSREKKVCLCYFIEIWPFHGCIWKWTHDPLIWPIVQCCQLTAKCWPTWTLTASVNNFYSRTHAHCTAILIYGSKSSNRFDMITKLNSNFNFNLNLHIVELWINLVVYQPFYVVLTLWNPYNKSPSRKYCQNLKKVV